MGRRSRAVVALVGLLAVVVCGGAASSSASGSRVRCPVGSARLRTAVARTLGGLDPGVFRSFWVAAPPAPPIGHYWGSLWAYATIHGRLDPATSDLSGIWE